MSPVSEARPEPADGSAERVGRLALAVVVAGLRRRGLWLDDRRARLIRGDQSARGAACLARTLPGLLDETDLERWRAGRLFGRPGPGLARRAAVVAGFGQQLGFGLGRLAGREGVSKLDLCGHFFLGTALFDRLCDAGPETSSALLSTFDAAMLRTLFEAPREAAARLLRTPAAGIAEFRLLFALIAAVFEGLAAAGLLRDEGLQRLIWRSYVSQAASVTAAPPSTIASDTEAGRSSDRRELPFLIVARVARGEGADAAPAAFAERAAVRLGEVLSWIDDVADLADDLAAGAPNAVAERAGIGGDGFAPRGRTPDAGAFAEVAADICDGLDALLADLRPHAVRMDGGWGFEAWILAAVRGWLEPASRR